MGRSLTTSFSINPPKQLAAFLDHPRLVGNETRKEYFDLLSAIVEAERPEDAIDWLLVKDAAAHQWDIQRERAIKAHILEALCKEVVLKLLKSNFDDPNSLEAILYRVFNVADDAEKWSSDRRARKAIAAKLASRGHSESEILAKAYMNGAGQIDAVERRIATFEQRRTNVLRELERRRDRRLNKLENSEIIDAEFTEATK